MTVLKQWNSSEIKTIDSAKPPHKQPVAKRTIVKHW